MAATKARTSIWSAQTLTAGAGNTSSSVISLTTTYGSQVDIKLTNGGTGPTVAAQVQVVVGNDATPTLATNFGGALVGSLGNSAISYFSVEIPIGVESVQLVAGSNTGQNVTVDADISSVTGL
jgi:hypothetical protein